MKRLISALVLLTATSVGVAGCGGDDDDDNNTGGKGGTSSATAGEPAVSAGQSSTPPNGGSGAGGSPSGNVSCDPSQNGVCQNETDCPSVSSGDARMAAGTCGQGCLGSSDKECAVKCITDKTGMTGDCATCYAQAVACATKECLVECVQDPESDGCKQCQVDKGCRSAFNDCSGLPD
jgi:hypothetical protein